MIIYHITTTEAWQAAQNLREYKAQSLETEGFIHCSTKSQVAQVANTFYSHYQQLIVLCIDSEKLISKVKWEPPVHPQNNTSFKVKNNELFPHVYGVINLDSVVKIINLTKNAQSSTFLISL